MKYFLFLPCILLYLSGIAQNKIYFSGIITNQPGSKFEIIKLDKAHDEDDNQVVKIKDGKFSVVINANRPSGYRCYFKDGEFDFYAMPGDSLTFTAVYNKLVTTPRFEGKGKETAQFNTAWKQKFTVTRRNISANRKNYTPERYLELKKNLLDSELAFLQDYASKNGLMGSPFYNYYVTDFKFSFYSNLSGYITDLNDIENDGIKPEYLPLLNILDKIDYDDPGIAETTSIGHYLMSYINSIKYSKLIYEKTLPPARKDSVFWFVRTYALSKKLLNQQNHERYVMRLLFELINPLTVGHLAPIYDHFIETCSQENRLVLEDAFKKYKRLSKNHKISGDSKIKKSDGGFKEILGQFKGTVLYVDFWASWCGPCIDEMPSSKEIQEKFKDKEVKFVFISVDQNEDSWKKAISMHKIPGIHFRLDEKRQDDLLNKLLEKGVPHYLIVGKDGEIIDSDAKRPSDAQLVTDLEKVL